MRDGGLRELYSFFYIAGTEARVFSQRIWAFFLERLENAPAGGVGDGMEKGIEIRRVGHQRKISRLRFELRATSCEHAVRW